MEKTLRELAEYLQGTLENEDQKLIVTGVNGLVEAGPQDISFAVPPHVEHCHLSKAGVMVLAPEDPKLDRPVIRVKDPRAAFAALLELFRAREDVERVISPLAFVAASAKIGKNVAIQPFAVIEEDAEIGDDSVIYPHVYVGKHVKIGKACTFYPQVTIRENCVIGNNVVLQSGCVIGGDGFGYITDKKTGRHSSVLQAGNVVLEDLVHLGHNDVLGKNCLVVAHVGISGSVTVGDNVTFAGQVGTVGHITIGDNCVFGGKTGITNNVPSNSFYAGFPARPHKEWLKQEANLRKIGDLLKKVKVLEETVAKLEK